MHQLALGPRFLKMQATQNAVSGFGVIVLHKGQINARSGVPLLLPGFHKISAGIAPYLGLDERDAPYGRCYYFHCPIPVSTRSSKYCP